MRECKWRNGAGGGGGSWGLLNKPQKAIRADVLPPGLLELISLHLTQLLHFLLSSKHASTALYGLSCPQQPRTHKPPCRNAHNCTAADVIVFRTEEILGRECHSKKRKKKAKNITPAVKKKKSSLASVTKTICTIYTFLHDQKRLKDPR